MSVHIVTKPIKLSEIKNLPNPYEVLIKGVVDLERKVIALGGEIHADAAEVLIEQGS